MVKAKVWAVINISLSLIVVVLLLNLFEVTIPTVGQAKYVLDKEDASCIVQWNDELNSWNDIDYCCLEAKKQLSCEKSKLFVENKELDWVCQTGSGDVLKYWLNNKAYNYCKQQVIW